MEHQNLNEIYLFHLEKAYKQFKKYKNDCFKKEGIDLTGDQWVVLKSIHENEGIHQIELAKKCFKEPASVTRILDVLERKTWVERRSMPNDRRTYELYTTDSGKLLIGKILPLAVNIRAKGMEGIAAAELDNLSKMLVKIFDNFS
ncbi:MAG: MarR family transcriptional regulator [Chitinophagales bacterium]